MESPNNNYMRRSKLEGKSREEVTSILKEIVLMYRERMFTGEEMAEVINKEYGTELKSTDILAYASKLRTTGVEIPRLIGQNGFVESAAQLVLEMDKRGEITR